MDTIKLNNNNSAFQLHGNVSRHSLKLFKVKQEPNNGQGLQLQVIDEKDMTMFTQDLNSDIGETEISSGQIDFVGFGPFRRQEAEVS